MKEKSPVTFAPQSRDDSIGIVHNGDARSRIFPEHCLHILPGPTGEVYKNCSKSCSNCLTVTQCQGCIHPAPETCFKIFMERCLTSKHRVTKVLRMDTTNVEYLLRQHKNLKLIQIFRDPRGTVNSRHLCGWYYGRFTIPQDAEVLCHRIDNDLTSAERLMRLFPGRVKILQYENFDDPFKVATSLYAFLNMGLEELTLKTLSPSRLISSSGNRFHPDSYRQSMSWSTIQTVQRSCHKVIERLGLRIFKNEAEFRNKTLDIVQGSLPYALVV